MLSSDFNLQRDIGQEVSFTTYNPRDPNIYIGVIDGFVNLDKANAYGNMAAYNQACRTGGAVKPITKEEAIQGQEPLNVTAKQTDSSGTTHSTTVQQTYTIPDNVKALDYFLVIKLTNTTKTSQLSRQIMSQKMDQQRFYAFAPEWINDATFKYLGQTTCVKLWVMDNPNNDHKKLLNILRESGYLNCGLLTDA